MLVANINGVGGYFFQHLFSNPVQYRRAGLDGREARRAARTSAHRHQVQITGFAPLAAFLELLVELERDGVLVAIAPGRPSGTSTWIEARLLAADLRTRALEDYGETW